METLYKSEVKMVNCISRDEVEKLRLAIWELFSSSHHLAPQSADVILAWAETIKSFAIYLTIFWF